MGIESLTAPGYKSIYRDYFLHQSHHAINSITGGIDISTNTSVYNIALGVEIYVRGVFSKLPSLFILTRPKLVGVPHGSEITNILIGEVVVNGNHLCTIANTKKSGNNEYNIASCISLDNICMSLL